MGGQNGKIGKKEIADIFWEEIEEKDIRKESEETEKNIEERNVVIQPRAKAADPYPEPLTKGGDDQEARELRKDLLAMTKNIKKTSWLRNWFKYNPIWIGRNKS